MGEGVRGADQTDASPLAATRVSASIDPAPDGISGCVIAGSFSLLVYRVAEAVSLASRRDPNSAVVDAGAAPSGARQIACASMGLALVRLDLSLAEPDVRFPDGGR